MQVIDFKVYSEEHSVLSDGATRIITAPTKLHVPAGIRRIITRIPDLAWLRIYDRLYNGAAYFVRRWSGSEECFYIKYGYADDKFMLISSRLLVVQRKTGEIFYRGSANDEG